MNNFEKTLKNMKNCASPSLAKWYKEKESVKIKMKNKHECRDLCDETCECIQAAKLKTETSSTLT